MADQRTAPAMVWDGWGDPARARPLDEGLQALLTQMLGVQTPTPPVRDATETAVAPSNLSPADIDGLARIVGEIGVATDDTTRLRHGAGKSTVDLLRRQRDSEHAAPDAVVAPRTHDEVVAVLEYCAHQRIAVTAFGGGTSVVGGLDPVRGEFGSVLALDLCHLDQLIAIDLESATATLGAGLTGPRAEAVLAEHGMSLGHFPQSFEFATIGGFAATRSAGQASAGYGRFDAMVDALTVATPRGTLRLGRAPATAAGPDLRQLLLGSEGTFGVITEVTLRVHPIAADTAYASWRFPDFATGANAVRRLVQSDASPTVLRLCDETETMVNQAMATGAMGETAASAIATFDGDPERTAQRLAATRELLEAHGGVWTGPEPAYAWQRGRFEAPYLRDSLLRAGAIAETLETATRWSNVLPLYAAATTSLTDTLTGLGTPPLVMGHISHTYPTGASLYFTVVCAQTADPITQWEQAKTATSEAIVRAGGTISHHHAVGRDHRHWMTAEHGDLGVEVLRAVKATLDPVGVLNPGKLIP